MVALLVRGLLIAAAAGVALIAAQILGDGPATPDIMTKPLKRFEFGPWRRLQLLPAYAWYGLTDRA